MLVLPLTGEFLGNGEAMPDGYQAERGMVGGWVERRGRAGRPAPR